MRELKYRKKLEKLRKRMMHMKKKEGAWQTK